MTDGSAELDDQYAGLSNWLTSIHAVELTIEDTYRWPWYRGNNARWQTIYKNLWLDKELGASCPACAKIISQAAAIRHIEPLQKSSEQSGDDPFDQLPLETVRELPFAFQTEYVLIAFFRQDYPTAGSLAQHLIGACDYPDVAGVRLQNLLLEIALTCLMNQERENFVHAPHVLADNVRNLVTDPAVRDILEQNTLSSAKTLGCHYFFQGQTAKAAAHMERTRDLKGFQTLMLLPTKTVLSIETLSTAFGEGTARDTVLQWFDTQAPLMPVFRHATPQDTAILVSCDERFFGWYAENFAENIGLSNPGTLIHYHLLNIPDDDLLHTLFDQWEEKFNVRINYTVEQNIMVAENPAMVRGAAANTRYSSLPLYLQSYKSLLICDIDGWIYRDLSPIFDQKDADICINSGIWRHFKGHWRVPWSNVKAGYMLLHATDATQQAVDWLAFYIKLLNWLVREKSDKGRDLFWADQSGAFIVLEHFQRNGLLKIGFLPPGFGQSNSEGNEDRVTARKRGMREINKKLRQRKG